MKHFFRSVLCIGTAWTVCLLGGITVFSLSPADDLYLTKTPDAGIAYLDQLTFLGESTTAHLINRAVLSGGKATTQVLANESGTMLLSAKTPSQEILHPKTGERIALSDYVAKEKPPYLVLSFGLNGIVGFSKNPELYLHDYQALIDSIQAASPCTAILLQTVYPVRSPKKANDWHFLQSVDEINERINTLNQALPTLAAANTAVKIVDTASVLRDESGALRAEYATEDGIHLRREAYLAILAYLRTHAYHLPIPLPITPEHWR